MNLFSLYAKIGLDTSEYDKGIKDAQGKAKGLASSLTGAMGTGISAIGKGVTVAAKGIMTATAAAGAAITALGAIGLNYNSQMETYTTNFEVMLGSQEAAAKKVEELKTMAAKTPFEMADLAKGTQTLLAFNVASDESTDVLTKLGDISLGNSEKLDSLTRAYGKMNAAQKVTLEDINMMIDAGYNPLLNIQEKTGESMSDLYDRISDGEVAFSEIQEAISMATSEGGQFYQGMEKASQTTAGLISTLKDNAQALVGEVFQPISAGLTSTMLPAAIAAIDQLTTAFQTDGVNGMIVAASDIISNALTVFTQRLPEFVNMAFNIVQQIANGIQQNLPQITNAAIQAIVSFVGGIAQMLPQVIDMAFQIVTSLATWLVSDDNLEQIITSAINLFTTIITTIAEWLPELIPLALQIVLTLAGALINNIPEIAKAAIDMGKAVVQGIIDGIANAWNGLVSWFNNLWNSLFSGRSVDVSVSGSGVDGSHRSGLSYVPFDGYIAELHKGEQVLTAQEASDYRDGKSGGGVTVIQNIYSEAKTAADLMLEARHQQERAVLFGV